ncbi:hypothetical protein Bbelb_212400 [Branchiostoma belcheri]|nr:hypothetical protein Bbelb_212400 [Branchiostoma belcheri]
MATWAVHLHVDTMDHKITAAPLPIFHYQLLTAPLVPCPFAVSPRLPLLFRTILEVHSVAIPTDEVDLSHNSSVKTAVMAVWRQRCGESPCRDAKRRPDRPGSPVSRLIKVDRCLQTAPPHPVSTLRFFSGGVVSSPCRWDGQLRRSSCQWSSLDRLN